ncbi:MAG: hypothetical protein OXU73_02945 [Candidatus Campbellbacteria bacterium]|nr:hypothetical protein [Candidatus Campbellbacteria bacterium]
MELNSLSMAIFVTYNESDGEAKGSTNLDEMERKAIVDALKKTRGNVSQAARELGKPRMALRYRIEKHGIDINEFRQSSE